MVLSEHTADLAVWELVLDVLKEKSISRAAQSRGIDRSQASRLISSLEKELGCQLFKRSGRTLVATQTRFEAAERMRPIIASMHEALSGIANSESAESGSIRFGSMPGFMQTQIVPLLVEFQKNYPGITFDVILNDDPAYIVRGQTDLMLYYGPINRSGLVEHFVTRSAFIACASPEYLKNSAPVKTPADLLNHAGVYYTGRVRPHAETLELGGSQAAIRLKSQLRFNNILSAKAAALSGAGIILDMPLHHCYEDILEGRLVPVLDGWHVPNLDNYIASTAEAARLKRVQIFVDWYIRRRREIESAQKRRIQEDFGVIF